MTTADRVPRPANASQAPRRAGPLAWLAVALAFALLVGLGVWQLQRLAWKTALLRHVEALKAAPAQPLAPVLARAARGEDVDFTRVETTCPTLEQTPTVRLYAVQESGMAYRLITACPLAVGGYRSILVDRGFVAREAADRVRPGSDLGATSVVGVLRKPDRPGPFTPKHATPRADWFGRDIPAMAAVLHAPSPAPVFLMLERPGPQGFGPSPAPLPGEIRNPHLGYALTWFGLAAALLAVSAAALLRRPGEA